MVNAGGFYLKSIGQLDVQSSTLTHYWYSGTNPTLTGLATAGSTIDFEVNGVAAGSAVVDSDGNWSQVITLNEGDNTVGITAQGVDQYTFILTVGDIPEGIGGAVIPEPETPPAGVPTPTYMLLFSGILAVLLPLVIKRYTASVH